MRPSGSMRGCWKRACPLLNAACGLFGSCGPCRASTLLYPDGARAGRNIARAGFSRGLQPAALTALRAVSGESLAQATPALTATTPPAAKASAAIRSDLRQASPVIMISGPQEPRFLAHHSAQCFFRSERM